MATLKCKMCGGDLIVEPEATVCECEYCGTRQTVPNADSEKKLTLFGRAGRLLRSCEFDKAAGVFETLVAEFPEEAEAYWGLVLCKYGIEYVDDPATGKKVPTCHRSSFDSVLDDVNYEQACENTDALARRVYRDEARQIEELRQSILEVSGKEEPYDVFISYKEKDENGERTADSVIAQDIYKELTNEGYRVFFSRISLESRLGTEYEPYIFAALNSARVMIVVGTDYENFDAVWVKNEWSRFLKLMASGQKKTLIPVFKNMDAYDMPKEFSKFAAQDMGKVGAMQDLLHGVEKLLGRKGETAGAAVPMQIDSGITAMNAQTEAMLKRGYMMLGDGDYDKADDFFERVLNNDAECGQAYWGKTLARAQVPNAEKYGSEALFNLLKEKADVKTVTVPFENIASLAREADESGMLKEFSDQELRELLTDLKQDPVQYQTAKQYYESREAQYTDVDSLRRLAGSRDFDRASQYADATVREAEQVVLGSFKERVSQAITEEEAKISSAQREAEKRKQTAVTVIRQRLSEVKGEQERLQKAAAEEQRKAEEQAEKDYQEAKARFEGEYQAEVAAHEVAYETELAEWELRKTAFEQGYDIAVSERQKLSEKIGQLVSERNSLKGLFTGKKRKELEENIAILKKKLEETIVPEDPGPKPVETPLPEKRKAPQREDFKARPAAGAASDLREMIKRSLSPAYKQYRESIKELKGKKPGDEISFGRYPSSAEGIIMPITWHVLAKEGNSLLVISKNGLDCQQYHTSFTNVTWETCTLRKWLNETFFDAAFITEEKTMIPTVTVSADKNPEYSTSPGNSTKDQVFLLSIPEANKYFASDTARQCKPTGYAKAQGCYVNSDNGNCCWWLRSPGNRSTRAARVDIGGSVDTFGTRVDIGDEVRPALWINLES